MKNDISAQNYNNRERTNHYLKHSLQKRSLEEVRRSNGFKMSENDNISRGDRVASKSTTSDQGSDQNCRSQVSHYRESALPSPEAHLVESSSQSFIFGDDGVSSLTEEIKSPELVRESFKHLKDKSAGKGDSGYVEEIYLKKLNIYEKWEGQFRDWLQPPSKEIQREFAKQIHAIGRYVRNATSCRAKLGLDKDIIEVSPQGSYGASTNTERSDIDIGIRLLWEPNSRDSHNTGFSDLSQLCDRKVKLYQLNKFVGKLLTSTFGNENVERSPWGYYTVSSGILTEVLPAVVRNGLAQEWVTDDGVLIKDQYKRVDHNRTMKHKMTRDRFKKIVRIVKNLRNEMKGSNIGKYNNITSHLIESIIYNAPDKMFGHKKITDDVKSILKYGILYTHDDKGCEEWKRLDGENYVFRGDRCWDRHEVHDFLIDTWNYIGFGNVEGNKSF